MTTDEEIADIERRMVGMSHGSVQYPNLNQRLITLRAKQKIEHDIRAEASRKESDSQWHKKPLGLIFIGAAGGVVATCTLYLIATHFGIRL